jgi:hypothetical protein
MAAMRLEHCAKFGHDLNFTTPNYSITTTPEKEWAVVVLNEDTDDMGHGRRVRPLADVMREDAVREAGLCEAEVVAVILYTGPMVSSLYPITRMIRSI